MEWVSSSPGGSIWWFGHIPIRYDGLCYGQCPDSISTGKGWWKDWATVARAKTACQRSEEARSLSSLLDNERKGIILVPFISVWQYELTAESVIFKVLVRHVQAKIGARPQRSAFRSNSTRKTADAAYSLVSSTPTSL